MKDSTSSAKLLDQSYAPETDKLLDELERTGQFRIGLDALLAEDEERNPAHAEYPLRRGIGSVVVSDWWTAGSIDVLIGGGIGPNEIVLARLDDSLVIRTTDGLDRLTIESYLGLIPDAATLRILFADGTELRGGELLSRISGWLVKITPAEAPGA